MLYCFPTESNEENHGKSTAGTLSADDEVPGACSVTVERHLSTLTAIFRMPPC